MSSENIYVPDCPDSYGDSSCYGADYKKPIFGYLPVAVSLFSCSLSVLGSIITILPYILWEDVRKSGIRRTITYLAIADLFTASGYIMASINYLVYQRNKDSHPNACRNFDYVCQVQAYIASSASYCSFWWTSILALFFYWTVVKGDTKKGDKYFPLYHILSWGSPILVMLPLLATSSLGYSLFSAGGWCFIKGQSEIDYNTGVFSGYSLDYLTVIKTLAGGKAFEITTYIWVIVFYVLIQYNIRKKQKNAKDYAVLSLKMKENCRKIEQKTLAIPIAFILLRMWGTIHFLFSIIIYASHSIDTAGCTSKSVYGIFITLVLLQSFGDGGQGWCNAILYIGLSPKIRTRLLHSFGSLCKKGIRTTSGQQSTPSVQYKPGLKQAIQKDFLETESPTVSSVALSMDESVHINHVKN